MEMGEVKLQSSVCTERSLRDFLSTLLAYHVRWAYIHDVGNIKYLKTYTETPNVLVVYLNSGQKFYITVKEINESIRSVEGQCEFNNREEIGEEA